MSLKKKNKNLLFPSEQTHIGQTEHRLSTVLAVLNYKLSFQLSKPFVIEKNFKKNKEQKLGAIVM